jgi:fumarate reductase subunit D
MIFFKNGVTRKTMFAPIIILILSLLTAPGWADEIAEATKEIVNKWQDAVVTTKIFCLYLLLIPVVCVLMLMLVREPK